MVWRSDIIVASEQSLPREDEFELVAAGGAVVTARSGRTRSLHQYRGVAAAAPIASPSIPPGEAHTGAMALAIGADGSG